MNQASPKRDTVWPPAPDVPVELNREYRGRFIEVIRRDGLISVSRPWHRRLILAVISLYTAFPCVVFAIGICRISARFSNIPIPRLAPWYLWVFLRSEWQTIISVWSAAVIVWLICDLLGHRFRYSFSTAGSMIEGGWLRRQWFGVRYVRLRRVSRVGLLIIGFEESNRVNRFQFKIIGANELVILAGVSGII